MGALRDIIQSRFGIETRPRDNPLASGMTTTVQRILAQHPDRVAFSVVNLGTTAVFIGSFEDVSSSKGYRLGPTGGAIAFLGDEDFDVVGYDWFGVADSGTPTIFVQEQIAE